MNKKRPHEENSDDGDDEHGETKTGVDTIAIRIVPTLISPFCSSSSLSSPSSSSINNHNRNEDDFDGSGKYLPYNYSSSKYIRVTSSYIFYLKILAYVRVESNKLIMIIVQIKTNVKI